LALGLTALSAIGVRLGDPLAWYAYAAVAALALAASGRLHGLRGRANWFRAAIAMSVIPAAMAAMAWATSGWMAP
jgi:hypothetical protein